MNYWISLYICYVRKICLSLCKLEKLEYKNITSNFSSQKRKKMILNKKYKLEIKINIIYLIYKYKKRPHLELGKQISNKLVCMKFSTNHTLNM
jgi:hypothetical protein